jgi:hypothetical protein
MCRALFASRLLSVLLLGAGLAGCGGSTPLVPVDTIQLTSATSFTTTQLASTLFIAGAIYVIYDPLAPNWQVEQIRDPAPGSASSETFRFMMKMKRYHTGGAGEAMMILRRQAAQLQQKLGYGAYQITAYEEGIESHTLGAQRYVQAAVQLTDRLAPPPAPVAAPVAEKSTLPAKTAAVTVPVPEPEIRQTEILPPLPAKAAARSAGAESTPAKTASAVPLTPSVVPVRIIPAPAPKSMPRL